MSNIVPYIYYSFILLCSPQSQKQLNFTQFQSSVLTNPIKRRSRINPGNQVVISSACKCPSYSTLSGVNCVCPEGNLVDNLCVCNVAGAELTPASKTKCICTTPGSTMYNNIQCKCSVTYTGPTGTSRDQNYWCPDLKMCCTKLKNSTPEQLFICSDGSYQKACTGINTIVTRE
ncbi:Hypothetical_protein [Hexamita inflata]|uniref:Hypothetical_protein n=1 Tax=Hexamita inflata TaxID=28002 RepID=A0AA86RU46_9EUKA|nr:Hypothetical protein HINF_LOCUS65589 [Hexamita inflata]